ncbi:hypothetical protein F5144DRAFT_21465 [Chaetomium tenue]|uniref:Uncharacterized protein n=1 Tax=Chaetomium tenue TaxID=1854479 RepID=A0ACB7PLN4_9PEZI|nr:hypothetical protein F5144DRAFT_21465 [Chaetomium globosum]
MHFPTQARANGVVGNGPRARSDKRSALYMCMYYVWTYLHTCCMGRAGNKAGGARRGSRTRPSFPPAAGPPRIAWAGFRWWCGQAKLSLPPLSTTTPALPHISSQGCAAWKGFSEKASRVLATGVEGWGEGLGHAAQHARRAAVDQISYPSEIALTCDRFPSGRHLGKCQTDKANTDPSRTGGRGERGGGPTRGGPPGHPVENPPTTIPPTRSRWRRMRKRGAGSFLFVHTYTS